MVLWIELYHLESSSHWKVGREYNGLMKGFIVTHVESKSHWMEH